MNQLISPVDRLDIPQNHFTSCVLNQETHRTHRVRPRSLTAARKPKTETETEETDGRAKENPKGPPRAVLH